MTHEPESAIRDLLGPGAWTIAPAPDGSTGRTWVVEDADRRYFAKEVTNGDLLRSLGELGITPRVVYGDGRQDTIVVQEFVEGTHPEARWVDSHIGAVGQLVKRYHSDPLLALAGSPLTPGDLVQSLAQRFDTLADQITNELRMSLHEVLRTITGSAAGSHSDRSVLTHGDPNTSNLIVGKTGVLYLVDWDEARLSDPARDIGQVLWWYVRPEHWAEGLAACGLEDDLGIRERVHWWAAAESAEVALGLVEAGHQADAALFARDALAAAHGQPNLRAWWRE